MMKKLSTYAVLFSLSILTNAANADLIYLDDNRYINHSIGGTYTPSTPYADFDKNWWAYEAGALQNSVISNTAMSGSGSTYAGFDAMDYGADGTSRFDVSFGVDQLTDFSLTGSLDTIGYSDGNLYVSLLENGTEIFGRDMWSLAANGPDPFSFAGQFSTGNTYQLILQSNTYGSDYYDETWAFNLTTVSAVPVPAAVWLFASGLFSLFMLTKRKSAA
jgi:hypothetical protein